MRSSGADSRLQTPHSCNNCDFLARLLDNQQSTINAAECRLKYKVNTYIMFCIIIIFEPYHFVLLLEAEDTGLQFCLILSWPLLSREKA